MSNNSNMQMNKYNKPVNYIIYIIVIVSVLSQISAISNIMRPFMYALWSILLVAFIIMKGTIRINSFLKHYILCYVIWLIICTLLSFRGNYLQGVYLNACALPILVLLIAQFYSKYINSISLQKLARIYVIAALVFAAYVNITYFPSFNNWLGVREYLFVQKNSAAQIWGSSILCIFFLFKFKSKKESYVWYLAAIYLLYVSGLSQCRTAILGLTIVVMVYIMKESKHKFEAIIIISVLAIALLSIPYTRSYFFNSLKINNLSYSNFNADEFSSGRVGLISDAWTIIRQYPILGVGRFYTDCFYVSLFAEGGIVGFLLISSIWLKRAAINIKNYSVSLRQSNLRNRLSSVCFFMTIFYFVESLLEGLPPFGPGVSCFMFWLLSGIRDSGEWIEDD